jgi:hypothetical protein
MPRKPKRGYSRKFTPNPSGHRRYLLDKVPVPLWDRAVLRARADGLSMRALILELLTVWLSEHA